MRGAAPCSRQHRVLCCCQLERIYTASNEGKAKGCELSWDENFITWDCTNLSPCDHYAFLPLSSPSQGFRLCCAVGCWHGHAWNLGAVMLMDELPVRIKPVSTSRNRPRLWCWLHGQQCWCVGARERLLFLLLEPRSSGASRGLKEVVKESLQPSGIRNLQGSSICCSLRVCYCLQPYLSLLGLLP